MGRALSAGWGGDQLGCRNASYMPHTIPLLMICLNAKPNTSCVGSCIVSDGGKWSWNALRRSLASPTPAPPGSLLGTWKGAGSRRGPSPQPSWTEGRACHSWRNGTWPMPEGELGICKNVFLKWWGKNLPKTSSRVFSHKKFAKSLRRSAHKDASLLKMAWKHLGVSFKWSGNVWTSCVAKMLRNSRRRLQSSPGTLEISPLFHSFFLHRQ